MLQWESFFCLLQNVSPGLLKNQIHPCWVEGARRSFMST